MCGRFAQHASLKTLMKLYNIDEATGDHTPSYNAAPMQKITAIISASGKIRSGQLFWGFVPAWAKDMSFAANMINARSETIDTKNSFKEAFVKKRCIIPVDGFYEWEQTPSGKQPWYFHDPDGKVMSMAGLWETWKGGDIPYHSCTILTQEANNHVKKVHDRMPVVVADESISDWLNPAHNEVKYLKSLIRVNREYPLSKHRVSRKMNKTDYNSTDCIKMKG